MTGASAFNQLLFFHGGAGRPVSAMLAMGAATIGGCGAKTNAAVPMAPTSAEMSMCRIVTYLCTVGAFGSDTGLLSAPDHRSVGAMPTPFEHYDVIVAGLGAMGSLTLYELASRGLRVMGFDRFAPPHAFGSSHGASRIIREAYFEDPRYVPLVQRAYDRWHRLERASATTLFRQTGGLMLGRSSGALVRGAKLSADMHGLPHEWLTATDIRARYPAFRLHNDTVGLLEPRAGVLHPERAIAAALAVATAQGALVQVNESLLEWQPHGNGVEVVTTRGRYRARSLVLTVGAWTTDHVGDLRLPLQVQRNVQFWFTPKRDAGQFSPDVFPVFICETAAGDNSAGDNSAGDRFDSVRSGSPRSDSEAWYGFPELGDGLKIARHHYGDIVHPDAVNREVTSQEVAEVREVIEQFMPDANGPLVRSAVCLYTNAPDGHFVIGRHPAHPSVVVASPCSGHGFKFASAIGEHLADLATNRPPQLDLSLFAVERFGTNA